MGSETEDTRRGKLLGINKYVTYRKEEQKKRNWYCNRAVRKPTYTEGSSHKEG